MRLLPLLLVAPMLTAQAPLAIVGATVVDPVSGRIPEATVLVRDGRIERVGPRTKVKVPADAMRIEAAGRFLIPGLIDAHVHFFQSGGLYTRPDAIDLRAFGSYAEDQKAVRARLSETFARYLRCGVTSVADMGGPLWNFEVRDLAAKSDRAPRVAVTGPLLSSVEAKELDLGDAPILRCATPDEAVAQVDKEAAFHPDYIKVWFVVTSQQPLEASRPMVRAAIQEAHRLGLRAAVHAMELPTAKAALEEGADILVHSVEEGEIDEAFLTLAKARHAIYIPTLVVDEDYRRTATQQFDFSPEELAWGDPFAMGTLFDGRHLPPGTPSADRVRADYAHAQPIQKNAVMAANLLKVARAGIPIAMGTDAGNIGTLPGPSVFRELEAMEAAGLPPLEVLKAATVGGAAVMGRADLGRVRAGALADLVLLDADPAQGTKALSRIATVFHGGRVLDPASLLQDTPEAVVQRQLDAYNLRELDAFCATYADDVQIMNLKGEVEFSGKAALRKAYGGMFAKTPKLHCQVMKRMVLGSFIVDEESVQGFGEGLEHGIAIYEVKDGLIRTVRFLR